MKFASILLFWLMGSASFCQGLIEARDLRSVPSALEDTLKTIRKFHTDSLESPGNFTMYVDSLQEKWSGPAQVLDTALVDISRDSLSQYYRTKADSLAQQGLSYQHYLLKADSLANLPSEKIEGQVRQWQQKAKNKWDTLKLHTSEQVRPGGVGEAITPGKESLPEELDTKVGDIPLNEGGLPFEDQLPKNTIDELAPQQKLGDLMEDPLGEQIDTGSLQEEVGQVKERVQQGMPDLQSPTGLEPVKENLQQVDQWTGEITKTQEGGIDGIEKRIESGLGKTNEISEIQDKVQAVEGLKEEHEEYFSMQGEYMEKAGEYADMEEVKKRITENSKKLANDKVLMNQDKVSQAHERLTKYKNWHEEAGSIKKLRTGLLAPVDNKSFLARARFTGTLELISVEEFDLDLAPGISFDLTKRISITPQFMYRFEPGKQGSQAIDAVYGPRLGILTAIKPGIHVILQAEQLRVTSPGAEERRDWFRGVFAGVAKSYVFGKKITGSLAALYRVYGQGESPYPNTFNLRITVGVKPKKE
ncbi:MAG: hypothetical protein MJA30_19915 [Cytophagales bacterium]|nr:hypothetical protein [Cytophagales bacterium]